jgi:ElaA protein
MKKLVGALIFRRNFKMKIEVKTLDEMTTKEFCKIAEERTKVFVVEQDCPYQEIDQLDYTAHHLVLRDDQGNFVGYLNFKNKLATGLK